MLYLSHLLEFGFSATLWHLRAVYRPVTWEHLPLHSVVLAGDLVLNTISFLPPPSHISSSDTKGYALSWIHAQRTKGKVVLKVGDFISGVSWIAGCHHLGMGHSSCFSGSHTEHNGTYFGVNMEERWHYRDHISYSSSDIRLSISKGGPARNSQEPLS